MRGSAIYDLKFYSAIIDAMFTVIVFKALYAIYGLSISVLLFLPKSRF